MEVDDLECQVESRCQEKGLEIINIHVSTYTRLLENIDSIFTYTTEEKDVLYNTLNCYILVMINEYAFYSFVKDVKNVKCTNEIL